MNGDERGSGKFLPREGVDLGIEAIGDVVGDPRRALFRGEDDVEQMWSSSWE